MHLLSGTPLLEDRSELDAQQDWREVQPGTHFPPELLDGVPLERIRLPDEKGRQRTAIYYNALVDACARPAPGAVVAQLLTNLRPEARPWIEKLKRAGVATVYSVSQFPTWPSKVSKRWFRIADTYGVEVAPGQNDVLLLAVTAVIDTMTHD